MWKHWTKNADRSGIRTHATKVTGALNQRLRPLGHPTLKITKSDVILKDICSSEVETLKENADRSGIRTHATEVTGALNQRLRPLGHPTLTIMKSDVILKELCSSDVETLKEKRW